jgi:hypothetical protein
MDSPTTNAPAYVPNYLVQAILATVFCCLPFGIAAIVFAAQVNGKLAAGDYAGAVQSSKQAKMWCWISFAAQIVLVVIPIILYMAVVAVAVSSGVHIQPH